MARDAGQVKRVFFGLGQLAVSAELLGGSVLPAWVEYPGALLGLAGLAVTRTVPDQPERSRPILHLNAAWMLAFGFAAGGRAG